MSTWPIAIRKNSGTVYERSRFNFVAGTNVTLDFTPGTGPGNEATITVNSSGGGGGAPTDATYITQTTNATLSAERVATDTATCVWDFGVAGQAKIDVPANAITDVILRDSIALSVIGRSANSTGNPGDIAATPASGAVLRESGSVLGFGTIGTAGIGDGQVTLAKLANMATDRLLGRDTAGSGVPEELTVGGGVEFTGSGIQRSALTGDVTATAGSASTTIAAGVVTLAKMADIATDRLIGRDTAGTGAPEALTVTGGLEFTGTGIQRSALTGDVTATAGSNTTAIANDAVTNAKLADVPTLTVKGRVAVGTGDPTDLTTAELTSMVNFFTDVLSGSVDASGGGTTNFLRADGSWTAPVAAAHATSHQSGGSDPIKLDDLATPDDNTDLNASVSRHGLLLKLTGSTSTYLRADGTWASVTASVAWTTVETNVGTTPKSSGKFTITDAGISTSSKVAIQHAPGGYTGKGTTAGSADEGTMDPLWCQVVPGTGSAVVYWRTHGHVVMRPNVTSNGRTQTSTNRHEPTPVFIGRVRGNIKFFYQIGV